MHRTVPPNKELSGPECHSRLTLRLRSLTWPHSCHRAGSTGRQIESIREEAAADIRVLTRAWEWLDRDKRVQLPPQRQRGRQRWGGENSHSSERHPRLLGCQLPFQSPRSIYDAAQSSWRLPRIILHCKLARRTALGFLWVLYLSNRILKTDTLQNTNQRLMW